MIVPDVNLLLHAYNSGSKVHDRARAWLEDLMNGDRPVGFAWAVVLGFVRITTHPAVLSRPLDAGDACEIARSWLERPHAGILHPGERHAQLVFGLLESLGTAGNLTTDAHLAALAIEHQAELHSTDADFARFAGLKWRNPLAK
jgi:toxin-antitoxin system PIN domain toxin